MAEREHSESGPRTRPGGRSARVRADVLHATGELLMETGMSGLTLHAIAQRSGVHHTTLSRRWGTVNAVVADAMSTLTSEVVSVEDRGSLQQELERYFGQVTGAWEDEAVAAAIRALIALSGPEYDARREAYWEERRQAVSGLLERGVQRGEIPSSTDHWTVFEQIAGPLWMRFLVTHRPITGPLISGLVEQAIATANASGR